jgi:hypothetical protein
MNSVIDQHFVQFEWKHSIVLHWLKKKEKENELFISVKQLYMNRIKVSCFGIVCMSSSDILFCICFTFS